MYGKENFGNIKWTSWPDEGIRFRRKDSVEEYGIKLKNEIDFHIFCQFVFRKQWFALKKYCKGAVVGSGLAVHGAAAAKCERTVAGWAKKELG